MIVVLKTILIGAILLYGCYWILAFIVALIAASLTPSAEDVARAKTRFEHLMIKVKQSNAEQGLNIPESAIRQRLEAEITEERRTARILSVTGWLLLAGFFAWAYFST